MKLSFMSLIPSVLGVAIVMAGDPTSTDVLRATVCFLIAAGMVWAGGRR
jgi:hypothetical protein